MFFRNLYLFRFPSELISSAEDLDTHLQSLPLCGPGPVELSTCGWVSPLGRDGSALTLVSGNRFVLMTFGESERILPSQVVNDELAERVSAIAEREGRRCGGKERKRIKEEIVTEFLPRAFIRTRHCNAYLDLKAGWLVVDTASRKVAEAVVSSLREALGRFPAVPLAPEESPRMVLTDWLSRAQPPTPLQLGDEAELRDPAEAGAMVRCSRQDLESDEVREHLACGKQVFRLGIEFDERLSLVLGEDLTVRKLRFLDIVLDELDEDSIESREDQLSASFTLMTLELQRLLDHMAQWFGISDSPSLVLDGGDAPKHMREAARGVERSDDELYESAVNYVRESRRASIAGVQRHLSIGYNRAALLVERMEAAGLVSVPDASGHRTVL